MNKLDKWIGHKFSSGIYTGEDFKQFVRDARSDLRRFTKAAGYTLCKLTGSHYWFSAVLQHNETGAYVYVSIGDVRGIEGRWYREVLYRTMKNENDFVGGPNCWCAWDQLQNCLMNMGQRLKKGDV